MKAIACEPWLSHLERHVPVALLGEDPEGIHQVRVAGRRLRVWLELGGSRVLVDDLRWLVRALSTVRDLDVMRREAAFVEGEPFSKWLAMKHAGARAEARAVLTSPRLTGILRAFRALPPLDHGRAMRHRHQIDRQVSSRVHGLASPGHLANRASGERLRGAIEEVHRTRRALRRLRYANDWLEEEAQLLKHLQEALGATCDVAALRRWVDEFGHSQKVDVGAELACVDACLAQMLALVRSNARR